MAAPAVSTAKRTICCGPGLNNTDLTLSKRIALNESRYFQFRADVFNIANKTQFVNPDGNFSDTTFGLRAMRAEVTGAVLLEQPQYQASELLIGVITHGFKVLEVPASIHKRQVGESKKGRNLVYGLRFMRVVVRTWWRERRR